MMATSGQNMYVIVNRILLYSKYDCVWRIVINYSPNNMSNSKYGCAGEVQSSVELSHTAC